MQNQQVNAPNGAICYKLWPQTILGVYGVAWPGHGVAWPGLGMSCLAWVWRGLTWIWRGLAGSGVVWLGTHAGHEQSQNFGRSHTQARPRHSLKPLIFLRKTDFSRRQQRDGNVAAIRWERQLLRS